jgi:hypothetical protein
MKNKLSAFIAKLITINWVNNSLARLKHLIKFAERNALLFR